MSRLKVLMSAYACEPGAGSEPGTGWAWATAAAQDHDVWLLTRANNAAAIEEALAQRSDLSITPVYLDLPRWASWWKKGQRGVRTYYVLWQWLALRRARELHEEIGFDVGHHITLAVDWLPAGIAWVPGLPLVWGPVGGTTSTPLWAYRWLSGRGVVSELMREITARPLRRAFGHRTARRARLVVAQNDDVARRFSRLAREVVVEPNCAVEPAEARAVSARQPDTAVFVGRLLGWKGVTLAIATIAGTSSWKLDIYGDGPEARRAAAYAAHLGVGDRVRQLGRRPRDEVLKAIASSEVLLFPSFHDSAGWSVAEAIAAGTPVLALDRGGPPDLLRRTSAGIAVSGGPHTERSLATVLTSTPWSTLKGASTAPLSRDRLPDTVRHWYGQVSSGQPQQQGPGHGHH